MKAPDSLFMARLDYVWGNPMLNLRFLRLGERKIPEPEPEPEKEPVTIIRVTLDCEYYVEMENNWRTKIDDKNIREVIKDWFEDNSLNDSHPTRDARKVDGSIKVIKIHHRPAESSVLIWERHFR